MRTKTTISSTLMKASIFHLKCFTKIILRYLLSQVLTLLGLLKILMEMEQQTSNQALQLFLFLPTCLFKTLFTRSALLFQISIQSRSGRLARSTKLQEILTRLISLFSHQLETLFRQSLHCKRFLFNLSQVGINTNMVFVIKLSIVMAPSTVFTLLSTQLLQHH